jgi:hypothetical protein
MKIDPRIRPAQDHYQKVFVRDNQFVGPNRRIEIRTVFLNPLLQMIGGQQFHNISHWSD